MAKKVQETGTYQNSSGQGSDTRTPSSFHGGGRDFTAVREPRASLQEQDPQQLDFKSKTSKELTESVEQLDKAVARVRQSARSYIKIKSLECASLAAKQDYSGALRVLLEIDTQFNSGRLHKDDFQPEWANNKSKIGIMSLNLSVQPGQNQKPLLLQSAKAFEDALTYYRELGRPDEKILNLHRLAEAYEALRDISTTEEDQSDFAHNAISAREEADRLKTEAGKK